MKTILAATALVATLGITLPLTTTAPAHAGGGDDVRRSGSCSGSTDWKIKARQDTGPDDGRIEVEAEIDSNVDGQSWHWRLRHDGNAVDRGTRSTHAPSGSFSVERKVDNHAGVDHFTFRAVHGNETCVAHISL